MTKDTELKEAAKKFVDAFEQVFDKDWAYTKEQLGIYEDTEEQKQNASNFGLGPSIVLAPDSLDTFNNLICYKSHASLLAV